MSAISLSEMASNFYCQYQHIQRYKALPTLGIKATKDALKKAIGEFQQVGGIQEQVIAAAIKATPQSYSKLAQGYAGKFFRRMAASSSTASSANFNALEKNLQRCFTNLIDVYSVLDQTLEKEGVKENGAWVTFLSFTQAKKAFKKAIKKELETKSSVDQVLAILKEYAFDQEIIRAKVLKVAKKLAKAV